MLDIVKNHQVNGLDMDKLGQVVGAVEKEPAEGKLGFDVTTRWTGGTRSESTLGDVTFGDQRLPRRHSIVADEPTELCGSDTAANPQELLMAALNACMTVGYVAGASMKGITLESLEIQTRGELDLRGFFGLDDSVPAGYETIDYEVRIKGDGSREDFEEIHRGVMATSPNYFNFSRPIRLNGELRLG